MFDVSLLGKSLSLSLSLSVLLHSSACVRTVTHKQQGFAVSYRDELVALCSIARTNTKATAAVQLADISRRFSHGQQAFTDEGLSLRPVCPGDKSGSVTLLLAQIW